MNLDRKSHWVNFRNWSFAVRLTLIITTQVVVTLAAVTFVTTQTVRASLTEQISESYMLKAEGLGHIVDAFVRARVSQIRVLAEVDALEAQLEARNESYRGGPESILAEIQTLDAQWVAAGDDDPFILGITTPDLAMNPVTYQLAEILESFPDHTEIFVTDRYGATLGATGRLSDYYQADEAWWQAAWNDGEGAIYISDPEYDESAGGTALLVAVPIENDETQEVIGIVRSTVVVDGLYETIESQSFGETGRAVLFGSSAEVLYEPTEGAEESSADLPLEVRQQFLEETQFMIATDADDNQALFAHLPLAAVGGGGEADAGEAEAAISQAIAKLGWAVVVRQETREAFAGVKSATRNILITGLVAILLAGLVGLFVARFTTRPLLALTQAAAAIGAGDLNVPLPTAGGGSEISNLTTSFGDMTSRLKETLSDLEQRARALETSAQVSRRLSTILDQKQLVAEVVDQVQRAFDYYHAHIYLVDEASQALVMAGGTGEAGLAMLAGGHKIPWGKGLVGRAAETRETVLVPDVSQAEGWLPNPLLPETRSEVAVPIIAGERVLGVLDVQHDVAGGLSEADADLLESIADQAAVALQNTRLFAETRQRAEYEARLNLINQNLQRAASMESLLQVAARELGGALGAQRVAVQLAPSANGDQLHQPHRGFRYDGG